MVYTHTHMYIHIYAHTHNTYTHTKDMHTRACVHIMHACVCCFIHIFTHNGTVFSLIKKPSICDYINEPGKHQAK